MVSPELVKEKRVKEIKVIFKYLKRLKMLPDAICTKKPRLWKDLYNEK